MMGRITCMHGEEKIQITLPSPELKSKVSIEEAIFKRRSCREYKDKPITLKQLSQILWACQGITEKGGYKRSAPSAGATYPLEIFVVVGKVEELDPGIYRYIPSTHKLELYKKGDFRRELARACLNQPWVAEAPLSLIFTAIFERTTSRYGKRGIRYVYIEVGHASQNVYLQCESLGLGTVAVGAFIDEEVKKVLSLTSPFEPVYVMPVGVK
ncbi:SagB/ThcOx family dehydrogenase [Candidatus Calescamantes bacterium]|nr:SagB/ThcOx family dehydrogenase [Candidatus Calescamantes bacterium]